jgi:hypothetical protein
MLPMPLPPACIRVSDTKSKSQKRCIPPTCGAHAVLMAPPPLPPPTPVAISFLQPAQDDASGAEEEAGLLAHLRLETDRVAHLIELFLGRCGRMVP